MSKKKESEGDAPKREYFYSDSIAGKTVAAKRVITISEKTSQKDLKYLFELGVEGINKLN